MKRQFFYFIIIILICSCKNKQMQIKEIDFYDYIYDDNERVKGYLIKRPSKDINELEKFLFENTKKILTKEFIQQSLEKINNKNPINNDDKTVEIDFFRVSKEIPWESKKDYIPPYHMGEGNPSDWIGTFIYNINKNEICYYFVCTRTDSLFNYGAIKKYVEYNKQNELF